MAFSGAIFDLDGTLMDTLQDIADSMNFILEQEGYATHPVNAYKRFVGNGILMLARRALPLGTAEQEALRIRDLYAARYKAHFMDRTCLYPGVHDMLRSLAAAGVKLAVVSNKPDGDTKFLVAALLQDIPFCHVQGQRPDVPAKPAPDAPLMAAAAMGLEPSALAYIGDSGVDMDTARNAGMTGLGVTWGFRGREELMAHGAHAAFDDAEALCAAILKY